MRFLGSSPPRFVIVDSVSGNRFTALKEFGINAVLRIVSAGLQMEAEEIMVSGSHRQLPNDFGAFTAFLSLPCAPQGTLWHFSAPLTRISQHHEIKAHNS